MKFKIDSRFKQRVQTYISSHLDEQSYQWHSPKTQQAEDGITNTNDEPLMLQIIGNGQWMVNYQHMLAECLLSQYHKYKLTNTNAGGLNVGQWMQMYLNIIASNCNKPQLNIINSKGNSNRVNDPTLFNPDQLAQQGMNNSLLSHQYHALKSNVLAKTKQLQQLTAENKVLRQAYSTQSQQEHSKIQLAISNLELRTKLKQQTQLNKQEEDCSDEVRRVKGCISNGLWGYGQLIQQKLGAIALLKQEIKQLANS